MDILGEDFKICEAFGGWGMNDVADSSCYKYKWEEYGIFV